MARSALSRRAHQTDRPPAPTFRTRRLPLRGPDGAVTGCLDLPDRSDPAFQAYNAELATALDAALERAADDAGMTVDEFSAALLQD